MDAEELRRQREKLGLTKTQLAHLVGVDPRTVRGWENGGRLNHGERQTAIPPSIRRLLWLLSQPGIRDLLEGYNDRERQAQEGA